MDFDKETSFLRWALPKMGYRWDGFRKPRGQVLGRIRERMQELGLSGGYAGYRQYLEEHPEEWEVLDRLCDVTISKFFRDRKAWEYLRDTVLPDLIDNSKSKAVTVWSIGCCNGEEAYGLAMINEQLAMNNETTNEISILATDRNAEVLERARRGRYPAGALKELAEEEIGAFFRPVDIDDRGHPSGRTRNNWPGHLPSRGDVGAGTGTVEDYEIKERLRQPVTFERRDIRDSMSGPGRTFDLVLCRNLAFTYFDREEQHRFLERLKPHLGAGGYLVIGANEELPKVEWLESASGTHPVFRKCLMSSVEC